MPEVDVCQLWSAMFFVALIGLAYKAAQEEEADG